MRDDGRLRCKPLQSLQAHATNEGFGYFYCLMPALAA